MEVGEVDTESGQLLLGAFFDYRRWGRNYWITRRIIKMQREGKRLSRILTRYVWCVV